MMPKLSALSLKSACIVILIRNHAYMNLTVLPSELRIEILEAIRDPHYGEHKVAIRHYALNPEEGVDWCGQHEIVEYLYHNDPKNPILRYYPRGTKRYNQLCQASTRHGVDFMLHYQGVLYDESRDVYVRAKYNCKYKVKCDSEGEGFLEEQLPPVLLKQLEDKKRLLPPMMVPLSSIKLIDK